MTTINQALDALQKSCRNFSVSEQISTDYFRGESVITITIPYGTPLDEEIEGTESLTSSSKTNPYKDILNAIYGSTEHYKFSKDYKIPEVREIRYNGPATIVFWEDNTKTVVKVQPGEMYYDPDKAFAMAVCKKLFGNKFNHHLTKAQKAFEKFYEEKCEKRDKEFIKNPEKFIRGIMNDFDKILGKQNLSVGTFDPDSVTTFKPKKKE